MRVALYARVSSEQQAQAHTIDSQLVALRERIAADGLQLESDCEFIDDGYSGATLLRPGLERLRDAVAAGVLDRAYIHSPDRLARKYAYQILIVDELKRAGVDVVFLNRKIGDSPEDDLLLQVQGMVAEYERAKILERSRRGKRHAAARGDVSVLSTAPYGYRYVSKEEGGGQARFEVIEEQARVIARIFEWVGNDRLSTGEVCRRVEQAGEPTRSGKTWWDRTTVWGMLKNPAYKGQAAFGKTRVGQRRRGLRPQRRGSEQPRRGYSIYDQPCSQWTSVPVPALVSEELFDAVQVQLKENQKRARSRKRGERYLLQGLVVCQQCGYAYYGKAVSNKSGDGRRRDYAYYRCIGTDAYRFGGSRVCSNRQVRTDRLDEAVWCEVKHFLADPSRIEHEHRRRQRRSESNEDGYELESLRQRRSKLRRGLSRIIDAYADGLIDKVEFEPRAANSRRILGEVEENIRAIEQETASARDLELVIGRVREFAVKVQAALDEPDWHMRREVLRTLVKRVEVDDDSVNVVFRVAPGPGDPPSSHGSDEHEPSGSLQHCWGRR